MAEKTDMRNAGMHGPGDIGRVADDANRQAKNMLRKSTEALALRIEGAASMIKGCTVFCMAAFPEEIWLSKRCGAEPDGSAGPEVSADTETSFLGRTFNRMKRRMAQLLVDQPTNKLIGVMILNVDDGKQVWQANIFGEKNMVDMQRIKLIVENGSPEITIDVRLSTHFEIN